MRGAAHCDKQQRKKTGKQAQSAAHADGQSGTQEQLSHGAGPEKFPGAAPERVQSKRVSGLRRGAAAVAVTAVTNRESLPTSRYGDSVMIR